MPQRRQVIGGLAAIGATSLLARPARAAERVSLGIVNTISDAPFFLADALGYFRDEGLDVDIQTFPSGANMVAPLGAGQLDIGAGALSAAFFNAFERNISLRIVADKARQSPGYGFQALMIRTALMEEGKFRDFADLKGLRIAIPSRASIGEQSILNQACQRGGLAYDAVEKVFIPTNEQLPALRNGAVDGTVVSEPTVSLSVRAGATRVFAKVDTFYPNQEAAVLFYGDTILTKRRDAGDRFMRAYLRGARSYFAALHDGHIAGPGAGQVIDIIARYAVVKEPALIRDATPSSIDPDGALNTAALAKDLAFAQGLGIVVKSVSLEATLDMAWRERAVAALGAYRPA